MIIDAQKRYRQVQSTYNHLNALDNARTRPPLFSEAAAEAYSRRLLGHAPFPEDSYVEATYNAGVDDYNKRYPNANLTRTVNKGGKSRKQKKSKKPKQSRKQKKSRKSRK